MKEQIPLNFENEKDKKEDGQRPYKNEEEKLAEISARLKKSGEKGIEFGDSHIWSIRDKNKKRNQK